MRVARICRMSDRKAIKRLVKKYLQQLGLQHWKLTRLYVGIPKHINTELAGHYPEANNGFYACVYPTGPNKFVMAISDDVPDNKLENVIAHEVSHILLHNLWKAPTDSRDAHNQLEIACNRIAAALTHKDI